MSYREYVIGAYAVFATFLAWDFLVPRIRLARARRAILQRVARESARAQHAAMVKDAAE
ncbi:heme exporter protein CcmD [Arenimonas sp. MALMAid1274]|uniref:heme exporter protein CcmD n=1 Tax=Arenimonas sp. MALMAid1274 TaxID=3411630 RepID=UPI003BA20110